MCDMRILRYIAKQGGMKESVRLSTKDISSEIDKSPQTVSRKLRELESEGLISRRISPEGQWIVITDRGEEVLRREYEDYRRIFESPEVFVMRGSVFTGLGEGRYYLSLDGYRRQISKMTGFEPYPGTLNIKISPEDLGTRRKLSKKPGYEIKGFEAEGRKFGGCKLFKGEIEGIECAIVIPERTHYPEDILEIVAPVNLREALKLKDGDVVKVRVVA